MKIIHRGYLYESIDRQVIVYHRTREWDSGKSIGDFGYDVSRSKNSLYGRGFYGCVRLEDIISPKMCELYGEFILKCRMISTNFLFADSEFDPSVTNDSIDSQLKSKLSSSEYSSISSRDYLSMSVVGGASIQNLPDVKILSKYFSGMFYRGSNWIHGPVMSNVVAWDASSIVPLSFAEYCVDGEYDEADVSDVYFSPISSRSHVRDSLDSNINQGVGVGSLDVSSFISDFRTYILNGFSEYDMYDIIKKDAEILSELNEVYASAKVSEMKKAYDRFSDVSIPFSSVEANIRSGLSFSRSEVLKSVEVVSFLRKLFDSKVSSVWKYIRSNKSKLLASDAIGYFFKLIMNHGKESSMLWEILFGETMPLSDAIPSFLSNIPSNVLINANKRGWLKLYKWMTSSLPDDVQTQLKFED